MGIEGPYRDESGGNRGLHDHPHRPAGESAAALRALPAAMPEGAQRLRQSREWRDLSMRKLPLKLRYRPRRVECPRCGVRVEDFPWAEPWARVTTALSNAVAKLARGVSWQGTARQYGLNWKSVATIVKRAEEDRYKNRTRAPAMVRRAEQYGLKPGPRPPVHVIGIDEVSRRKGQVYLTVVYDLERRVLLGGGGAPNAA